MFRSVIRQTALAALLVGLPVVVMAQAQPWVKLKGQHINVELAENDAARMRGLMYREHMATNHGMLFVFEQESPQAFWMKNTKIPLDMLFFDRRGKLVGLQEHVPPCTADPCPAYPSNAPALYVLELNGGEASRLGVKLGETMEIHR